MSYIKKHIVLLLPLVIVVLGTIFVFYLIKQTYNQISANEVTISMQRQEFLAVLSRYKTFVAKITEAEGQGIDVSGPKAKQQIAKVALLSNDFTLASQAIDEGDALLATLLLEKQQRDEAAKQKAAAEAAKATPNPTPKPAVKPSTPKPSTSTNTSSTGHSTYEQKSVSTSRGTFTINLMTFDLGGGHIKVITDTAADNDCSDNCPVKSVASYVSERGGFAGINGTYFCPADYSACSGKINTFYWKVIASRIGKMINKDNGLGETDPFMTFDYSGTPHYYQEWKSWASSGTSPYAGINSRPALIANGNNILDEGSLDDKQRTVKSNRGALGLKGQTLYALVAKSATVIDLAEIMKSLGVDSAMNIDGGGSSAIYYSGSYKVGPGRNIPNVVVFAEQ